ncbi:hypothetical protein IscW_ISCW001050 [Ixodes scapularis]|uniref:HAT C-terminal dimerisation domain-containing protein n=1 Tax=Ixodes scapularis TaxID=6945 RepID=B7P3C8_IXOSC|nr:hypothetical protein IscW_ISCW001050 [Ixodes scapularis]|eukprot:XP_002403890.1 hypothetical protein IscW_ISCW001050 [Ixodes scapularis]
MNDGETPLRIPQACDTRWLSIYAAVNRIGSQWDTLKETFRKAQKDENWYTALVLSEMYSDPINKCYVLLLDWVLAEAQRVNEAHQTTNQDPTKLLEDLVALLKSMASTVSLPTSLYDMLSVNIDEHLDPNPYFGHRYETSVKDAGLSRDAGKELRLRSRRFIVDLFSQFRQRLPENIRHLEKASVFSVENALKMVQGSITQLAAQFLSDEAVSACEAQWRNLRHVKWCSTKSTEKLWADVGTYKGARWENPFPELSSLAMTVLSLPFSNASTEKCFSDMNIVKSELRNRLDFDTLNANHSVVRKSLWRMRKKCHEYRFPSPVLAKNGTMSSYDTTEEQAQHAADVIEELLQS